MELKKGYKNTEIGVIPDNWGWDTLGNSINEMTDYVAAGSFDSLKENVKVYDTINYAIYVRLHDLRLGLCHRKQKYIDKKSYKFLSKSNLYGNEILMANIGANVGETLLMPEINIKASIAPNMIIIRSDDKIVSNKFLFYYTQSDFGRKKLFELIAGSGHPKINKTDLKKLLVIIPPLPEQSAIATVLSDTDSLIQALEKKIAKKHLIKKGAMQKLLTPKEGWEVKSLGEICDVRKGQLITSSTKIDGNIPVIAGGKTPAYYHKYANRNGKTITISASGANAGYIAFHNYPIFASDCSTISESKEYTIEYIYFILLGMQDLIYKMQTGGAQPHIHPRDIKPITIPFPPISKQIQTAQILSDMDSEIEALQKKLDKYNQLKLGMMQNLLTGKIRLV